MIFLFFIDTIFELSIFTIVHLNLNWLTVSKSIEKGFADLVIRLILVPLVMIISSNILLYSWKYLKWAVTAGILLLLVLLHLLMVNLGIISGIHWNMYYSAVMFGSCILFSGLMAEFIIHVGLKEAKKAE